MRFAFEQPYWLAALVLIPFILLLAARLAAAGSGVAARHRRSSCGR